MELSVSRLKNLTDNMNLKRWWNITYVLHWNAWNHQVYLTHASWAQGTCVYVREMEITHKPKKLYNWMMQTQNTLPPQKDRKPQCGDDNSKILNPCLHHEWRSNNHATCSKHLFSQKQKTPLYNFYWKEINSTKI